MTKYIFVTGGVVSSLGKGSTSASIGMLLEHRGLNIRLQKLDPYINVDPGSLSPAQHGEVYVLEDGSTTDLDLGHYERFTSTTLAGNSSWTTGQIYQRVFEKERRGEYQGATVQVIPHITDEIKQCLAKQAGPDIDVVITEIGGTVGDIESLPHMEAIRQFALDVGKENCLYIHLTLIPYLKAAREIKTKPTQHSVGQLRQIGIQPDILICRTAVPISAEERSKIGLFCNIEAEAVIEEKDKDLSIYEVPLSLTANKLDQLIVKRLGIENAQALDLSDWQELIERLRTPQSEINVAVVGEYARHQDAYKSVYEALEHAGIANRCRIRVQKTASPDVLQGDTRQDLQKADAIIVAGSFGEREIDGKLEAVRIARENRIPFLGIDLGLHCAVIEFARNVLDLERAGSTEYDRDTPHPVVCLVDELPSDPTRGIPANLGAYESILKPNTKIDDIYGHPGSIRERFRHRYAINNQYRSQLDAGNMRFSATDREETLIHAVEIVDHPFFISVQYHPEFKSQPTKAHPLFVSLVAAALEKNSK